jgi:hypothetical protein
MNQGAINVCMGTTGAIVCTGTLSMGAHFLVRHSAHEGQENEPPKYRAVAAGSRVTSHLQCLQQCAQVVPRSYHPPNDISVVILQATGCTERSARHTDLFFGL